MIFDLTSSLQVALAYTFRDGDVVSYAVPPRPDIVQLASELRSVATFGTSPSYTAYRLRGQTHSFSVFAGYGLTRYLSCRAWLHLRHDFRPRAAIPRTTSSKRRSSSLTEMKLSRVVLLLSLFLALPLRAGTLDVTVQDKSGAMVADAVVYAQRKGASSISVETPNRRRSTEQTIHSLRHRSAGRHGDLFPKQRQDSPSRLFVFPGETIRAAALRR